MWAKLADKHQAPTHQVNRVEETKSWGCWAYFEGSKCLKMVRMVRRNLGLEQQLEINRTHTGKCELIRFGEADEQRPRQWQQNRTKRRALQRKNDRSCSVQTARQKEKQKERQKSVGWLKLQMLSCVTYSGKRIYFFSNALWPHAFILFALCVLINSLESAIIGFLKRENLQKETWLTHEVSRGEEKTRERERERWQTTFGKAQDRRAFVLITQWLNSAMRLVAFRCRWMTFDLEIAPFLL